MIGIWSTEILPIDYIMYWQNVADNSLRSDLSKQQAQHQTGKYARGNYFTMESVYWLKNVMKNVIILCSYYKSIHETKTKYEDKITIQNA